MNNNDHKKKHTPDSGFTLVELIVVLVILAILAAILTPALLGYIDSSRRNEELTRAKALYTATQSKLTSLYDQGIMPTFDHNNNGIWGHGAMAYSWLKEWGSDCIFSAGLSEDPYICGFYAGSLIKPTDNRYTYYGKGLSGLKKGYTIYVFAYLESSSGKPWFYYNGEWTETPPEFETEPGYANKILSVNGEKIYLAEMCVFNTCAGDGSAYNGTRGKHTEDARKTWDELLYSAGH